MTPRKLDSPAFYAVFSLKSARYYYQGNSLFGASEALLPGTVHGMGETQEQANARARMVALRIGGKENP